MCFSCMHLVSCIVSHPVIYRFVDERGTYPYGNNLDSMGAKVLADAISNSYSMTMLDVSGNKVCG
jgi:hypothetical protein